MGTVRKDSSDDGVRPWRWNLPKLDEKRDRRLSLFLGREDVSRPSVRWGWNRREDPASSSSSSGAEAAPRPGEEDDSSDASPSSDATAELVDGPPLLRSSLFGFAIAALSVEIAVILCVGGLGGMRVMRVTL